MTSNSDNTEEKVYDNLKDGETVEKIDMKERPNLIDNVHEHDWSRELGNEETEDYYAVRCVHCPIGMLISKHET